MTSNNVSPPVEHRQRDLESDFVASDRGSHFVDERNAAAVRLVEDDHPGIGSILHGPRRRLKLDQKTQLQQPGTPGSGLRSAGAERA